MTSNIDNILTRKKKTNKMTAQLPFTKGLKGILRSASALLLSASVFALNHSAAAQSGLKLPWPPLHPPKHPVVPEVNTGLVLIPVIIAILLLSWRHLWQHREAHRQ